MSSIISVSGDKITESRIAQAINEIPTGVAVVDSNRRFRFRNTLFERQHTFLILPAPVHSLGGLMQAVEARVTAVIGERGQDISLHSYTYRVSSRSGSIRFVIDTGVWYEYSFSPFGEYDTLISCRNVTREQNSLSDLKDLKYRYEQFYDRLPAMIHSVNETGQIVNVSDRWLEELGYDRHEVVGRKITQFVSEKSRPLAEQVLKKFSIMGDIKGVRYHMLKKDGEILDVSLSGIPELDRFGKLIRSLSVLTLADSQQNRNEGMHIVQELAMTSLNDLGDALMIFNRAGLVSFLNPVAERLTGWLAQEAAGQLHADVLNFVDAKTKKPTAAPVEEALSKGQIISHQEVLLLARDKAEYRVRVSVTPAWAEDGEVVGCLMVFRDVTSEIKTQRKLAFYSQLDPLTRLSNRKTFTQTLQNVFDMARKSSSQFGLLFIDIDKFRVLNDLYGNSGGDLVLRQVADRLRKVARDTDYIGRVAGDKFAVILRNTSKEAATAFAEKFRKAMTDNEFQFGEDSRLRLSVSIGCTMINKVSKGPQSAMAEAEGACQLAKEKGRNRVQFFETSEESFRSHQTGMVWVSQINESVRNDQMRLLSMPIQALSDVPDSSKMRGEILLRMVGSNGSLISPQQFLPAAEHYQVVESIDRWVVENLFATLAKSSISEKLDFFAVNLSVRSILNADFHQFVSEIAQKHPKVCQQICFQIVESAVMEDMPKALGFMEAMKDKGCRIALDDFGSSDSSFTTLRDLPLDFVRIDGAYLENLLGDNFNQAVVKSISTLAGGLGALSIAERVESQEVMDWLAEHGLDFAQGFHVGRPVDLHDILK